MKKSRFTTLLISKTIGWLQDKQDTIKHYIVFQEKHVTTSSAIS